MTVRFDDIKDRLSKAINQKIADDKFPLKNTRFSIIEGFFNSSLSKELTGNLVLGGPTLPMIAIVDDSSGLLYFFPLKALLPDLQI